MPSRWSVRSAGHVLEVRLVLEGCIEVAIPRRVQRALRQGDGAWRAGCETGRDRAGLGGEIRRCHDATHEADPLRFHGRHGITEQRDLGGLRRADETRQEPRRATVRHEPHPPEREREARRVRRQTDVARHRERRTRARRDAVDGAHDRLRQRAHGTDDRVVALPELDAERRGIGLEPLLQVLPGAEGSTGTGQDHRANTGVPLQAAERRQELQLHGDGQRVEGVRPVEGDGGDPSLGVDLDEDGGRVGRRLGGVDDGVGHELSPRRGRARAGPRRARTADGRSARGRPRRPAGRTPGAARRSRRHRRCSEPATRRSRSGRATRIRAAPPHSPTMCWRASGSRIRAASAPSPVSEDRRWRPSDASSVQGADADQARRLVVAVSRSVSGEIPQVSRWSALITMSNAGARRT